MSKPSVKNFYFPGVLNSFMILLNLTGLVALSRVLPYINQTFGRIIGGASGLPGITRLMMGFSPFITFLIFGSLALLLLGFSLRQPDPQKVTLINTMALIGQGLFLVGYIILMYLPMFLSISRIS